MAFLLRPNKGKSWPKGHKTGGLYALEDQQSEHEFQAFTPYVFSNKASLRVGHMNDKFLKFLASDHLIELSSWKKEQSICDNCQLSKSCKLPFFSNEKISLNSLDKIHCDLWGLAPILSCKIFKFYASFIETIQDTRGYTL